MGKAKVISYRLTKNAWDLIEQYTEQLYVSRSRLITYAIYEMLIRERPSSEDIFNILRETQSYQLEKTNKPLHVSQSTFEAIEMARHQAAQLDPNKRKLHRNQFLGMLVSYYFEKLFLKKNDWTCHDLKPRQVAIYLHHELKRRIEFLSHKYRLSLQLLFFDILKNKAYRHPDLIEGVHFKDHKKERIITILPNHIHHELINSPLSLSFLIELCTERYLRQHSFLLN